MQLGLIGLGKMGANMRTRIERGGHKVVGYDPRPEVSDVASMADMVAALDAPRAVWIMVPSGVSTSSPTISSANAPASVAEAARRWLSSA